MVNVRGEATDGKPLNLSFWGLLSVCIGVCLFLCSRDQAKQTALLSNGLPEVLLGDIDYAYMRAASDRGSPASVLAVYHSPQNEPQTSS